MRSFVENFIDGYQRKDCSVFAGANRSGQEWYLEKQEFILETFDTYPKKICIAVWGDKIDLSPFKPGDTVDVSFDVESREYNGRWYTDVKAWKVLSKQSTGNQPAQDNSFSSSPFTGDTMSAGTDDDLPF
jgi:Protein of unknown function (DUF3127).